MDFNCSFCWDLGPPPDMILTIPPPPLPAFLQLSAPNLSQPPSCNVPCDWSGSQGVEYVEVPRHGEGSVLDDTWLFVLISCSVGVLLLGSLLALVLLKCRDHWRERGNKGPLQLEPTSVKPSSCEAVLYPGADSRTLWATLTPRGTLQHIAATHRPHQHHHYHHPHHTYSHNHHSHHHHHHHHYEHEYESFYEPEDYCLRPRVVSSPTRIENPNLPPLNLHRTLRRPAEHTPVL